MPESPVHTSLKERFAGFERAPPPPCFALGEEELDRALGGGLARGRLHELWPAAPQDGGSALGFALMLAIRAGGAGGTIVWITQDQGSRAGHLYPPGLAELGADPARLLWVTAPDEPALMRAAADVVRSPAAGTAVIAPAGPAPRLDLTASRRLTLAAERSGVTAILLRTRDPEAPSAAATRWRVAAAPSQALAADAPGHPAFTVDCVRRRGGPPLLDRRLEWRRDDARFQALLRDPPADAGGGRAAAGGLAG